MYQSELNRADRSKFQDGGFKKTAPIYEELINEKTGRLELKKTGDDPFYQRIQEEKEEQLLDTLINRYKVDLNTKKVTQLNEEIVDMTVMPADLLETYALAHKLEKQFQSCSAEIKNHFGDFSGYLKAFQSGTLGAELQKFSNKAIEPEQPASQAQPAAQLNINNGGVNNEQ